MQNNKHKFDRSIPSLSSSCLTRGSIKKQCQMDTLIEPEYDKENPAVMLDLIQHPENNNASLLLDTGIKYQYDGRIESGRSMVEVLGTLAIIGVLSVGGIVGYSYAMDKYRANTIINDIMLRAIDVNAQIDTTGNADLSAWPQITAGKYPIGLEEGEFNGVQVNGLEKELCQMVFDGMISNSTIKINTTEYNTPTDDICGDTNTMVFYVNVEEEEIETITGENFTTDNASPEITMEPPLPSTTTPAVSDTEITIPETTTPGLGSSCYSDSDCGQCQKCDYDYSSYPYQKVCVEDSQQSGKICGLPTGDVGSDGSPIYQLGGGVCFQGNCVPNCYSSSECNSGELCLPARQSSCSTPPYSACQKALTNEISISYTDENGINRNETWYEVYQMGLLASAALSCDAINKELPTISDFVLDWDDGASAPKQYTLNNRSKALFPKTGLHEGVFWTGNTKDSNACNAYMITTNGYVGLDGKTYYLGGVLCKDKN